MPKNDKTRKNSNNVRGPYREFDPASQAMREVLIRGYAKRYIENVAANNGKCTYGFVVGLARESSSSNVIFGSGDGTLGPYARDEAIRRRQARIDKVNAGLQKKKLDLSKSLEAYLKLKLEPNYGNPDFKWTVPKLKIAIKVKKLPGDKALPSSKEALLDRYNKTKRRPTPQPSPATSDDEASSDEDSDMEDNDGDSHVGLVFGDDDSSSETSDDELEDESEDVDNE